MTTVLRASDSAEFLRIVPSLAGFTPTRSIVLLPFSGKRTYGAMRLDLPDAEIELEDYADAAVGLVSRVEGTDAVALVLYCDDPPMPTRDGLVLPFGVEVDELLGCAEDAGLRIVDALCVTPGGWASYLLEEPELQPLAEIGGAPEVPGIGDVTGDQLAGTELPAADLAERERVGRALLDLDDLLDRDAQGRLTGRENPQAIAALVMLDDIPAFFESVLERPQDLPAFATAALLWCLDRPLFRDVALTQWASDLAGGIRALDAQLAFSENGTTIPDEVGSVFLGQGPAPDPDRLRLALAVVRLAASRAPRPSRRGPLTAAAWLSWALGRSTHAGHYLELVREIDPEYGLAALLETMIGAAALPEWAFRRGAAGGAST
ncbi:lipopolysaccharide biosynthesis protein [Microbacterium sp. HM58-2]|nr:lipopolysaccharide biosynthesis protein [Microbacterium sp. HM58-2]